MEIANGTPFSRQLKSLASRENKRPHSTGFSLMPAVYTHRRRRCDEDAYVLFALARRVYIRMFYARKIYKRLACFHMAKRRDHLNC